jgi:MFS family permease
MAACLAPLYGKLADVAGRKYTLISAVLIFILGSGLCGGAQTPIWLIMARGVQGMGGGGIIQLVQITISDITALQDRGKFTGMVRPG